MSALHEERRPRQEAANSKSLDGDSSILPQESTQSQYTVETDQRRNWARRLLEAGSGWPIYGSATWNSLPAGDPRRVAACVAAAEAYTQRFDDLEMILHRELEQERLAHKQAEDRAYADSFAGHIKRSGGRIRSTFEERRQRQLEAAKPRPGDYPGGPGKPWTIGGEA